MGLGALFQTRTVVEATVEQRALVTDFVVGGAHDWAWAAEGPYRGGMGLPAAWRAAVLISDLLGSVPWHGYRERAGRPAERLTPTPPLLDQPSPPDVRVTSLSSLALDLLWNGNAIGLYAAVGRDGYPTAITPVPAEGVWVKRVERGDGIPLPLGSVAYQVGDRWYAAEQVVHVKGPCRPGALRGLGVLECHLAGSLALAGELNRQARGVADAAVPSMVVKSLNPDLTEPEAHALKAQVLASQRTRSPMVLNPATDLQPISWNPTETQLLEARRMSSVEIANIFGLDASWLNAAQSSRVYSNVEQEAINLARYTLGGHLARFEQTFSAHMPRGTWATANLDSILRADTKGRYEAHALGITNGFLTRDEARELENRPPLTPAQRAELTPTPAAPPSPAGSGPDDQEGTP